jgi:hypothetical protein
MNIRAGQISCCSTFCDHVFLRPRLRRVVLPRLPALRLDLLPRLVEDAANAENDAELASLRQTQAYMLNAEAV